MELANPRGATNAGRHTMRATGVELANPRGATNAGRHTMRAKDVELANPRGNRVGDKELAILMDPRGPAETRNLRFCTEDVKPAREDLLDARRARGTHVTRNLWTNGTPRSNQRCPCFCV